MTQTLETQGGPMKALRAMLANRDLARVEAAWAAASLGNWAFAIVLAVHAYGLGGPGAVATALVARMLPAALAAPYTAVLADRHSRRAILLWSCVLRAAALLGAAAAAGLAAPLGVVLVFAALFAAAHTAHRPAHTALMPQLARNPAELAAANAGLSVILCGGFLLGSLLAGVLVSLTGLDVAFAACAAAFVAAALVMCPLAVDVRPPSPGEQAGPIANLSEGVRTVRRHPEMRLLVSVYAIKALVEGILDVLLVVSAIELLRMGDGGAGWLSAAWGLGGVLGGAASLALLDRGGLAKGMAPCLGISGLAIATITAWPDARLALAALLVMGIGFAVVETALQTLVQRLAPNDVLARVFGVHETLEVVALMLGSFVAAGLVSALGVRGAVLVTAAVLPLVGLVIARRAFAWEAGAAVPQRPFALIHDLPLFAPLPIATLENITLGLSERRYDDLEEIVIQGDLGDAFFVIDEGQVLVEVDAVACRRMGPGEFFGEIALLRDVPRTATVRAVGPVRVLTIERGQFLAGVGAHPRSATAAQAVAGDRLTAEATLVPVSA